MQTLKRMQILPHSFPMTFICDSTKESGYVFSHDLIIYFDTALTFESDRLPAICSVAISILKERFVAQEVNANTIIMTLTCIMERIV